MLDFIENGRNKLTHHFCRSNATNCKQSSRARATETQTDTALCIHKSLPPAKETLTKPFPQCFIHPNQFFLAPAPDNRLAPLGCSPSNWAGALFRFALAHSAPCSSADSAATWSGTSSATGSATCSGCSSATGSRTCSGNRTATASATASAICSRTGTGTGSGTGSATCFRNWYNMVQQLIQELVQQLVQQVVPQLGLQQFQVHLSCRPLSLQ